MNILIDLKRGHLLLLAFATLQILKSSFATEIAEPPLQTFYKDEGSSHQLDKRAIPFSSYGKKDIWTVSQRSMPSLRLRFGKRASINPIDGVESELEKRGNDKSNLRLRFGKRQEDQSSDDISSVFQDVERRGGDNNLRLRFGKKSYDFDQDSYYHSVDQRANPGLRLRFGKRLFYEPELSSQNDLDDLSAIQERGGNPGLRLRFGKRFEGESDSDFQEDVDHELERRGGGPSSRLRFGKRFYDENYIKSIMDRRGGRFPSSRLRFGKRDTNNSDTPAETEETMEKQ